MTTGIILLNFGEPATPTRENVVSYLEGIFLNNASLDGDTTEAEARERSRALAERRAPGLIEEYEEIGGSPLGPQAEAQAEALEAELEHRGFDARTYVGMQFTDPSIEAAVEQATDDGVDELVGLPVYPLCGPSTTVAALEDLADAAEAVAPVLDVREVTGWHRHPTYNRIRAENVAGFVDKHDLNLNDDRTTLLYSVHGTPQKYLDEGSRYVEYVEEFADTLAANLGVDEYELGYQNHSNRDVEWTQPDVEDVVETLDADRVVVEPISFMHEQSETLSELDVELREEAEAVGLDFYRVPVPHDDDRFSSMLADLVEPFLAGFDPSYYGLHQCQCRNEPGTVCLNSQSNR